MKKNKENWGSLWVPGVLALFVMKALKKHYITVWRTPHWLCGWRVFWSREKKPPK